jgi:regulator of sigma E protease
MDYIGRVAAIAIAFGATVFVHELGHFLAARLSGMAVHEFSIGFGRPVLFSHRRGKTKYSLRLWPFFSFVHIAGMQPGDEHHPRGFPTKSRPIQAFVLITGCIMNFLLAVIIYIFMGTAIGMPVALNTIEQVVPNSPAAQVGLMPGDRLIGADGRTGLSVAEIRGVIQDHPDMPLTLEIEREGQHRTISITPRTEPAFDIQGLKLVEVPIGLIGVYFGSRPERMGIAKSVAAGFTMTYEVILLNVAGLIAMLTSTLPPELYGPVGVVHVLYQDAGVDWLAFLSKFALVTVAVGFVNLMPLPPLDGSRLAIVALEAIRRKPFDKRKEVVVHLVGFALLLALAVVLTYKDILRIITAGGG